MTATIELLTAVPSGTDIAFGEGEEQEIIQVNHDGFMGKGKDLDGNDVKFVVCINTQELQKNDGSGTYTVYGYGFFNRATPVRVSQFQGRGVKQGKDTYLNQSFNIKKSGGGLIRVADYKRQFVERDNGTGEMVKDWFTTQRVTIRQKKEGDKVIGLTATVGFDNKGLAEFNSANERFGAVSGGEADIQAQVPAQGTDNGTADTPPF